MCCYNVDFGDKYEATAKRSREQIFVEFQAVPALFGLMTESKGFAQEEFEQAFKLYNKTVVKPIQKLVKDTLNKIFGMEAIEIVPFSMEEENTNISLESINTTSPVCNYTFQPPLQNHNSSLRIALD